MPPAEVGEDLLPRQEFFLWKGGMEAQAEGAGATVVPSAREESDIEDL